MIDYMMMSNKLIVCCTLTTQFRELLLQKGISATRSGSQDKMRNWWKTKKNYKWCWGSTIIITNFSLSIYRCSLMFELKRNKFILNLKKEWFLCFNKKGFGVWCKSIADISPIIIHPQIFNRILHDILYMKFIVDQYVNAWLY